MTHLLLKTSKRSRRRETPDLPPGAQYDVRFGMWTMEGTLLAKLPILQRATKKADIETGEDQKGQ